MNRIAASRRGVLAGLLCCGLACGLGSSGSPQLEPGDAEPPKSPTPVCRAFDIEAAVTTFEGELCPWVLTRDDGALELSSQAPDAPLALQGEVPPECTAAPCDYSGEQTSVGPLVLAAARSPASEMPAAVLLGLPTRDRKLVFVDLWDEAGDAVFDEGTELGPTHGLAPFDCGGKLGLFAVPRTNAGEAVATVPALRAREGVYEGPTPTEADRDDCTPIPWPMP